MATISSWVVTVHQLQIESHKSGQDARRYRFNTHTVQTFNSCTSRLDVCQCLVAQSFMDNMSWNKSSTSMTHVAGESTLHSVVLWGHPCPLSWVAIGRVFMYYARAAHAFSTGIKCRLCTCPCEQFLSVHAARSSLFVLIHVDLEYIYIFLIQHKSPNFQSKSFRISHDQSFLDKHLLKNDVVKYISSMFSGTFCVLLA